ncbi:MAG TPA: hypothetical protein VFM20_01320 [Nitrososphaeraceae archaeon]|nr:hypothetical protein [Nitrososphaeraceae archaeon]
MIRDSFTSDEPEIYVEKAQGGEYASKLTGYFIIKDTKLKFKAIAFGRIGGHNISLNLTKKTLAKLKELGYDTEDFQLVLQRKLVEGEIILIDPATKNQIKP